jgi:bisphosphoglycerate-dependent phosphoglycerate mutase
VLELNIATGAPIIYELDASGRVLKKTVHELSLQK